jgi:quercetin dioxygenase-like cupin family protein
MEKIGKRYVLSIGIVLRSGDDSHSSIPNYGGLKMKRYLFLALAVPGIFSWAGLAFTSAAHDNSHEKNAFTPDTISWGAAPPVVRPGAQFAVLEGDPTASTGDFTIRMKMPDGYRIAPHWHPKRENVTILSGTFKVGMGDAFDASKMKAFSAGSFAFLDPDMHHYAMASGETIVQVHGQSPLQFNYVNPDDDPSKSK